MINFLSKVKSSRSFSVGVITQTVIGFTIVLLLLLNLELKNSVIEIWTPYLLVYLGYLIIISPLLSRQKSELQTRRKFVTAREELIKAMRCVKSNPEDVLIHIRSAIDLSIKERFGFTKIHPMMKFLETAKQLNFPLPSYDLIYQHFDTGSNRLHSGTLNTPFEVNQITRTVAEFMNELDKIQVTQNEINEFKNKCKFVE